MWLGECQVFANLRSVHSTQKPRESRKPPASLVTESAKLELRRSAGVSQKCHELPPVRLPTGRLTKHMEQERFPADDELYRFAREAYNAMPDLTIKAHYLGCKGQTG